MESNTGLDHWDVYTPFVLKLGFYSETTIMVDQARKHPRLDMLTPGSRFPTGRAIWTST